MCGLTPKKRDDVYVSCFHPITAYNYGMKDNGKSDIRFKNTCDDKPLLGELKLPCGRCIGCRLQYSRLWADRLVMELQNHDSAYFITLTYSDEYINNSDDGTVRRFYSDPETGEAKLSLSLCKADLQKFWKRLRKEFPDDHIRYFACGEYGDHTKRPHYHAIIYGLHLDDLKFYKMSSLQDKYYNSPRLEKVWNKGFVVVGDVTWKSCAYTARYVVKKALGNTADSYGVFNMSPEFVCMSRRPGIGKEFYNEHKYDFVNFGESFVSDGKGSIRLKMPRYFESMLEIEEPEVYESYKDSRCLVGKAILQAKLSMTDLSENEYNKVEEDAKLYSTKALKREI